MSVSPQLPATDYAALEKVESREEREALYERNAIYKHAEPQGTRYTKGNDDASTRRSWQSLDVILRSDAAASEALPNKQLRLAKVFLGMTLASAVVLTAGAAASAREGLDLRDVTGPGAVLLAGGITTLAFGITSGILYGKAKKGYERAVDVYNDNLGMRLGILDAKGNYVPPAGTLVDDEGYMLLDDGRPVALRTEEGPLEGPDAPRFTLRDGAARNPSPHTASPTPPHGSDVQGSSPLDPPGRSDGTAPGGSAPAPARALALQPRPAQ